MSNNLHLTPVYSIMLYMSLESRARICPVKSPEKVQTSSWVSPVEQLRVERTKGRNITEVKLDTLTDVKCDKSLVRVFDDSGMRIRFILMNPADRPSYTPQLLKQLMAVTNNVKDINEKSGKDNPGIQFVVFGSCTPDKFNEGGDLELFKGAIETGEKSTLLRYAGICLEGNMLISTRLGTNTRTLAFVQGDALGGGFEMALNCDAIVAEKRARAEVPEIKFNLFPGMGAFGFLARRIHPKQVEKMLRSGHTYSAEDLKKMGIVDEIADNGQGIRKIYEFLEKQKSGSGIIRLADRNPIPYSSIEPDLNFGEQLLVGKENGNEGIDCARDITFRDLTTEEIEDKKIRLRKELKYIGEAWVDTALNLRSDPDSLRLMGVLVKAQSNTAARCQGRRDEQPF